MGGSNGRTDLVVADVPADALDVATSASSSSKAKGEKVDRIAPARVPTGARAEILAICTQASGNADCDSVRVECYGETIIKRPVRDPVETSSGLIGFIAQDADGREPGTRHAYKVIASRGDRDVYEAMVRVTGGGIVAGDERQLDVSAHGLLREMASQQRDAARLVISSHTSAMQSLQRENDRKSARVEFLEEQNDKLRRELREALEQGKADAARAETERNRAELVNRAGQQLIKFLPLLLRKWFPMPEGAVSKERSEQPAPASFVRALASVTDEQLAKAKHVLSAEQRDAVDRARGGDELTIADVIACSQLSDEAMEVLPTVLRMDQVAAILEAGEAIKVEDKPKKKGKGES